MHAGCPTLACVSYLGESCQYIKVPFKPLNLAFLVCVSYSITFSLHHVQQQQQQQKSTFIGIATARLDNDENLLHKSVREWWMNINSEVLLLTFLPGLVYKDASSLHVHLFGLALSQCLIFAFPMVLAGTFLTALVCYYILPYDDWSFSFCMTAGSILSATDPVAVAALLDTVGAPPRLKVHIAGESLLNDGSAIVFFTIFGLRLYLSELNVDGMGEDIDLAAGVKLFFRMSLGAVAIGMAFALVTVMLMAFLNRRLNHEENVVEVALEITVAYLCYFVAEIACGTSGVIATVTLGVLVNGFGYAYLNDRGLRDDFQALVEHMLNTVLFALGGLVFGGVIANADDVEIPEREFGGRDWGYLIVLYLLLTVIRFGLFFAVYPLTSRIGLKSSLPEVTFQSFGGLRGAVGIALAISLDNLVRKAEAEDSKFVLQTNKLFGFVGGIAFMTLMINATTAGPLLKRLGLSDPTEIREGMLQAFERNWKLAMVDDMVRLLAGQVCYSRINFSVILHHVPMLAGVSALDVKEAADAYKAENEDNEDYKEPNVEHILSHLEQQEKYDAPGSKSQPCNSSWMEDGPSVAFEASHGMPTIHMHHSTAIGLRSRRRMSAAGMERAQSSLIELRRLFLELLRGAYERQIRHGELTDREFVAYSLLESLDLSTDRIQKGEPLNDWELSKSLEATVAKALRVRSWVECFYGFFSQRKRVSSTYALTRIHVEGALSFVHAHQKAQQAFRREFALDKHFSRCGQVVLDESMKQVQAAEAHLLAHESDEIEAVISHKFCTILLLNAARYVERVTQAGLLKATEADEYLEEVQQALHNVDSCSERHHQGETMTYNRTDKADVVEEDVVKEDIEELH